MSDDPDVQHLLDTLFPVFRGLGEPTRQVIFRALVTANGSGTVSDIVAATGLPQSTVSRQLAVMKTWGLVSSQRRHTSQLYAVTISPDVLGALEQLTGILQDCSHTQR